MRLAPLVGALMLALASPGFADGGAARTGAEASDPWLAFAGLARPLRSRAIGTAHGARPTPLHPYRSLQATAFPLAQLGFWAQGEGYSLSRRTSLYDLEGGAVLLIDEGVGVTASYRMLNVDLGYDSDIERSDIEPGIAAAFIGVVFDF